mgnify:CR=1 FL=1
MERQHVPPHDGQGAAPAPKLLEVNFMGDLAAPRVACEQAREPARYHEFVDDLVDALATDADLDAHPRFARLRRAPPRARRSARRSAAGARSLHRSAQ